MSQSRKKFFARGPSLSCSLHTFCWYDFSSSPSSPNFLHLAGNVSHCSRSRHRNEYVLYLSLSVDCTAHSSLTTPSFVFFSISPSFSFFLPVGRLEKKVCSALVFLSSLFDQLSEMKRGGSHSLILLVFVVPLFLCCVRTRWRRTE